MGTHKTQAPFIHKNPDASFSANTDSTKLHTNHSHSIINRPPKPAWLKGLAVINIWHYRHFYRKKRASFAGAGDGAICGAATLGTPSSITSKDTGGSSNHLTSAEVREHRSSRSKEKLHGLPVMCSARHKSKYKRTTAVNRIKPSTLR